MRIRIVFLLTVILSMCSITSSTAQVLLQLDSAEIYRRCAVLFRYVDEVTFEGRSPADLNRADKKLIRYHKGIDRTFDGFRRKTVYTNTINIHNLRVFARVEEVFRKRKLYFRNVTLVVFEFSNEYHGVCQGVVDKFSRCRFLSDSSVDSSYGGYRHFVLDSAMLARLKPLAHYFPIRYLISEYGESFMFPSSFFKDYKLRSGPYSSNLCFDLRPLIRNKDFEALRILITTESPVSNWLAAEEISYYHAINPFLPPDLLSIVEELQLKREFRGAELLRENYPPLSAKE